MFLGIQGHANSQKVWSEAKNGERDRGETPIFFFSRLTCPIARARLLRYAKPIFRKKKQLFCSLQSKRSLPNTAKDISGRFLDRGRLCLRWAYVLLTLMEKIYIYKIKVDID